jgi:hypothetical protein
MYPINIENAPPGFERLADEPLFDPAIHLALEKPQQIVTLSELGYDDDSIADCPSDFAVSSVFRVLSDEGAAYLYDVVKKLEAYATRNARIERNVRGGVYRSKFLRDLCLSPDINNFLSEICGVDLMPHTIPHQLGHINFNPREVGKNVDKWHADTLRYDYVMFVTDPNAVEGGAFQYFNGTKEQMANLKAANRPVPLELVRSPEMPGAGYAIMQQGNMVVHQAKGLTAPGERITMVNGYVAADAATPDYTRYDQLVLADPEQVVTSEFVRHIAFQGKQLLEQQLTDSRFSADRQYYADQLDQVACMLADAAFQIRNAENAEMEHFGD